MANILESLRKHNKSDLIDLVKMHLSFLVEVTSEEWERIVAYVDKEEAEELERSNGKLSGRNSQTKYFTSTSSATSTESCKVNSKFGPPKQKELASNTFGSPLSRESLDQVMILVDFLNEDENYKLEGVFRKSGTQERQQDLRYMLNNGARVDLKANRFTPVDTSCVLKEFVQRLPEPLLTSNHFELHYELALAIKSAAPEEQESKNAKRLKIIQLLLHLLPELNRRFFMSLMALLNRVAKALDVTKMDERSLATIFGQHILCPRTWTPKQVHKNIEAITDAMEFLLINYENLNNGPTELVLDAKKKLKKYQSAQKKLGNGRTGGDSIFSPDLQEDGDENNTVITFCQRKESQDTITDQALAELYAQVQAMPETPQKRKLIKQFNRQNGFGTPMHVTSKATTGGSSRWKNLIPPILRPKH